ncbi:MAG: exonuclease, polymerase epsilon subunit family [Actinomycetia bacterium]|nr:exonuclease, polymerase epsilon subunit family [Actinomycetes bacterium]
MVTIPARPEPLPGFVASTSPPPRAPHQGSLDDLGTPLSEVTFVVVDLETTGGSPVADAITEIGALKLRGGELLGTFDTLVNPGVPIPPLITVLTGITETMVMPAPRIGEVLPAFLEFAGPAVIVGHNIRFDISFLDAALVASGRERLTNRRVDTIALARRLVRDEVPNLRLSTLAAHFRTTTQPVHRAFADAGATAELLHALLERAASFGVLGLDDLLMLPTIRAHPSAAKLAFTARLPREPGVYAFRDRGGRVLYVGKAANLRSRVRSYFSGDDRRKVPQLLREAVAVDHRVCAGPLEAAVRELRLIQSLRPRFNRQAKAWRKYAYVKLTNERFPRVTVTRVARDDGSYYLGPLPSSGAAHLVREAIETAVPLRRCTTRIGRRAVVEAGMPCVASQLGVAACPCRAQVSEQEYACIADVARQGITSDPALLLQPLEARMTRLAAVERFEEAAATRDRAAALARALRRRRMVEQLQATERLVFDAPEGRLELRRGLLVLAEDHGTLASAAPPSVAPERDEIDELLVVARFLEQHAHAVRVVAADGTFASALPQFANYEATRAGGRRERDRDRVR